MIDAWIGRTLRIGWHRYRSTDGCTQDEHRWDSGKLHTETGMVVLAAEAIDAEEVETSVAQNDGSSEKEESSMKVYDMSWQKDVAKVSYEEK